MKYKNFAIAGVALGSFFATQLAYAQNSEVDDELLRFCSRFPNNSRCEGVEPPIPLAERSGEEAGCNFVFDPQETDGGSCKINADEAGITIYQEVGRKLEVLDEERNTIEIKIPRDRIFATNFQVWNKVRRWEVGFLPEENVSQHQTNFLVMFMDEEGAESLMSEINSLPESKPELLTEILATADYQTPEIDRLIETKKCEYCDLSNADLSGVDLKGANLVGANLQGANLVEANLEAAYLLGANLEEADLTDAEFKGVNLAFGNLSRATLVGTEFEGSNLQEANLQGADLQEADLAAPSYLKGANLQEANLTDANIRGANLQEANLQGANLEGANLKRTGIKLKDVPSNYSLEERLVDTFLIGFPILGLTSGSDKVNFETNLKGANLEGANLSYTSLDKVIFEEANLTNVDFTESDFDLEELEEQEIKLCGVVLADGSTSDRDCE